MKHLLPILLLISATINGQKKQVVTILSEGFESGNIPATWMLIDEDGDGEKWEMHPAEWSDPHSGEYSVASYSWFNGNILTPNNWLISPVIDLGSQGKLSYYVKAISENYSQEHYQVRLSTTGTEIADFTEILIDETLPEANNEWLLREVDLIPYSNELIYIAFVHNQSTNMFALKVDDITVEADTTLTGIPDYNAGRIIVYPNPSSDMLNIKSEYQVMGVIILDIIGKQVYSEKRNFGCLGSLKPNLEQGQYIVKIQTTSGICSKKILVQ